MSFCAPENAKNHLFHVFGLASQLSNTIGCYFSQKIKIFKKPVIMVLEGLKYKLLAFETITHVRDNTFAKYRHVSESRFTSKMCSFSVQNHKLRSEQKSIFVKVF